VKCAHPSSISSLSTFALLIDLAGISTEFSGAITTQFCFSYSLGGVTAMPRGLHAKLCHLFLVIISLISDIL